MVEFNSTKPAFVQFSQDGVCAMRNVEANFITTPSGRKKAVILPIREYERLLEDLHDLSVVAERREETPLSLAEMKQRLEEDAKV